MENSRNKRSGKTGTSFGTGGRKPASDRQKSAGKDRAFPERPARERGKPQGFPEKKERRQDSRDTGFDNKTSAPAKRKYPASKREEAYKGKERFPEGEKAKGYQTGFSRKAAENKDPAAGPNRYRGKEKQDRYGAGSDRPYAPARKKEEAFPVDSPMTLNKYIAHSGACSRRDAAEFVKLGKVRVNGELILEPGYRVSPGDQITLSGKKMTPQKGLVYILLNKPKDYITTADDPEGRKTVLDLVENSGVQRLFPVGRLDRNTTGLLLLTNDGTLAHKLSHPSYRVKKIYQVTLDKNLSTADYQKIVKGLTLEDGKIEVDEIAYLENRNEVGLEIHSGKNRIVRRIFESLGYKVEKLDRVIYAGLTKKNIPRGKWRFLTEQEVIHLKHFKS